MHAVTISLISFILPPDQYRSTGALASLFGGHLSCPRMTTGCATFLTHPHKVSQDFRRKLLFSHPYIIRTPGTKCKQFMLAGS